MLSCFLRKLIWLTQYLVNIDMYQVDIDMYQVDIGILSQKRRRESRYKYTSTRLTASAHW